MPLRVFTFSFYLTTIDCSWRQADYDANLFVKALKNKQVSRYADIPVAGTYRRLTSANPHEAAGWLGEMVAAKIPRPQEPLVLVPVPNSSCTCTSHLPARTLALAISIAAKMGTQFTTWDGLRWIEEREASSAGGSRDVQELYENLTATSPVPAGRIVLVDDVLTTGAHLRAAAAVIRARGGTCHTAIVAARTVHDQQPDAFGFLSSELEDFTQD